MNISMNKLCQQYAMKYISWSLANEIKQSVKKNPGMNQYLNKVLS